MAHLHKSDYSVRTVPLATCEELVTRYHYAKGGSNTATFRHGLFHRDHPFDCLGVAWWIPPTRAAAQASWDGPWQEVLSLSRVVLVPELPTCAASFLIGRSIRLVKADGRWCCLITYADTWQGHVGVIYQATNWERLGETEPEPRFVDADGRMVARKAGPVTRTRDEMAALGYRCVGSYPAIKYRMILHPARRKTQMELWEDAS